MNEIIIANPNRDQDAIVKVREMLIAEQKDAVARIEADSAAITAENYGKYKLNGMDSELERVKTAIDTFTAKVAADTGADAILVQLAAFKAAVDAALKDRKAKIRDLKAANEPPAEKLEYVAEFRVSQKEFDAMAKKWTKDGMEFRARRVKDNESAKIGKIFEEK